MKIAVLGYSGSGKSTLAKALAEKYGTDALHLDSVHFLPGWTERTRDEQQAIVKEYMDSHDAWVIDGNYTNLEYERRLREADMIIIMIFNRFSCLYRAWKRNKEYKGKTRDSMAPGCPEKLDREFIMWILRGGRSKAQRRRYKNICSAYAEKITVIRNQRELNRFYKSL